LKNQLEASVKNMKTEVIKLEVPADCNLILGQSHFIKTIEDIYEAMVNTAPSSKFGVAFCESSGPCLVRREGNDENLVKAAAQNALRVGAGHCFILLLKNAYPINVLNTIKNVPEVCHVYCATANPVEVVVAETELGRGILGVIDGKKSAGIEGTEEVNERKKFLRKIGYKF
jgi:hypothetical protein